MVRLVLFKGGLGAFGPPEENFLRALVKPAILKLRCVLGWTADLGILNGLGEIPASLFLGS